MKSNAVRCFCTGAALGDKRATLILGQEATLYLSIYHARRSSSAQHRCQRYNWCKIICTSADEAQKTKIAGYHIITSHRAIV